MTIPEGIAYGLLQGITEFLPVSSSGHLALAQNFFGGNAGGDGYFTFMIFLHLGTLAAVIAAYYKDVFGIVKAFFTLAAKLFRGKLKEGLDKSEKLFLLLAAATLPLFAAAVFADKIENLINLSRVIGGLLIINGVMLFLADKIKRPPVSLGEEQNGKHAKPSHALIIGFFQLLGVLPGISRSGSTITGGLAVGLERTDAVKFSFLMSIPAIAGANILELFKIKSHPLPAGSSPAVIIGVLTAAAAGMGAIKLLQYMAKNKKLTYFSVYCIIAGSSAIIAELFI